MDVRLPPNLGYNDPNHHRRPRETTLEERENCLAARERRAAELDRELEERRQDLEVLEMQLAEQQRTLDQRESEIAERERLLAAGATTSSSLRPAQMPASESPQSSQIAAPALDRDEPERTFAAVDPEEINALTRDDQQASGIEAPSYISGIFQRTAAQSQTSMLKTASPRLDDHVAPGEELTLEPDVLGALRGGRSAADSGKSVRFVEPERCDSPQLLGGCTSEDTGSVAASVVGSFAGSLSSSACVGPGRANGMRTKRLTARKRVGGSDASLLSGGTVSSTSCSDETTAELGGG